MNGLGGRTGGQYGPSYNGRVHGLPMINIWLHSDSLTWKWKMGPWKSAVLYKRRGELHFHVSESKCIYWNIHLTRENHKTQTSKGASVQSTPTDIFCSVLIWTPCSMLWGNPSQNKPYRKNNSKIWSFASLSSVFVWSTPTKWGVWPVGKRLNMFQRV